MLSERAWGYAMQLRQESNTEPRKRFHLVSKLRKAVHYAEQLESLCQVSIVFIMWNVLLMLFLVLRLIFSP